MQEVISVLIIYLHTNSQYMSIIRYDHVAWNRKAIRHIKIQRINQDQSWNAAPHLDGHSMAAKHAEIQFAFSQRML